MNEDRLQTLITALVENTELFQAVEHMVKMGRAEAQVMIVDAVRSKDFEKATSLTGSIDGMENLLAAMKHVAMKNRGKKAA